MIDYTRLDSANTINGKKVSDDDWNDMYEKWLEASHVLPALLYPKVVAYPTITSTFFPLKATPYL